MNNVESQEQSYLQRIDRLRHLSNALIPEEKIESSNGRISSGKEIVDQMKQIEKKAIQAKDDFIATTDETHPGYQLSELLKKKIPYFIKMSNMPKGDVTFPGLDLGNKCRELVFKELLISYYGSEQVVKDNLGDEIFN